MTSYGKGNVDKFSTYHGNQQFDGDRGSDFSKLSRDIISNIQKITQNVSQIQNLVNQIGTPQDSDDVRQNVNHTIHYTNQMAKDTSQYLIDLTHLPMPSVQSEQRERKIQKERLTDEFSNVLKNFQTLQRTAAEKEKASVQRAKAHSGLNKMMFFDEPDDKGMFAPGYSQTKQVLLMEQDVDLDLIKEREDTIKMLENDILDVNQIFKDLSILVHEQGHVLDSIEANIESSNMSVEEGVVQLRKAQDYQRSVRRKKFCIVLIILVVLTIIGLIIGLSVHN